MRSRWLPRRGSTDRLGATGALARLVLAGTLVSAGLLAAGAGGSAVAGSQSGGAAAATCVPKQDGDKSVARRWNEALLDAIRRDLPQPTKHARNLFHVSAAMWDAWAAYDPVAEGYFVTEKLSAPNIQRARERAMSYAAYRVLSERYRKAIGARESLAEFDRLMADLCYPTDRTIVTGDSPTAVGNRIAAAVIQTGLADGSREKAGYRPKGYQPVNDPLIVKQPGTTMVDPNRWQPLALDQAISQNGLAIPDKVQSAIGPHWGHVTSFGLPVSHEGIPIDPGAPPRLGDPATDAAFKESALDVIRASSQLDPADGATIDISPASLGDSTLGTNDGTGYRANPVTGEAYSPEVVPRADFARVLAEFWADGPASETPPGHWNVIANEVTDSPGFERRMGGSGPILDPLEWDVKTYFALNGALHDAAVAAWGLKGYYDTARPISMIRYMGGLGQSSDPAGPSYDPEGLPLEPGLVEVITPESSAPGERHAHLADHLGEIAVRSWLGVPDDPSTQTGGVGWILATEWVPYQLPTFVTPAFPAYVSGHSTFSRAAAEVMTALTGSPYFPGGIGSWTIPVGSLRFEAGPTQDITLEWATYRDAADQAGLSRIYGGIHIPADDFAGRMTGYQCGRVAWDLARRYFEGTARQDAAA